MFLVLLWLFVLGPSFLRLAIARVIAARDEGGSCEGTKSIHTRALNGFHKICLTFYQSSFLDFLQALVKLAAL